MAGGGVFLGVKALRVSKYAVSSRVLDSRAEGKNMCSGISQDGNLSLRALTLEGA